MLCFHNKFKKYGLIVISTSIISLILTGCWNYREIDETKIVLGMAIDKDKSSKFKVTQEFVDVKSNVKKQETGKVVTNTGESIFETLRGFIEPTGNYSYGAHTKVIIIGKNYAEEGIISLLDFMMRDPQFKPDTNLLVSQEEDVSRIFTTDMENIPIKSLQFDSIFKNQGKIGTFETVNVWNFIDKLSRKGYSPVLPLIKLEKQPSGLLPRVNGLAIFKNDKMIGQLDGKDVLYYLFIDNEIENQIISLKYKMNNQEIPFALEIINSSTNNKPIIKDGQIVIQINIKCEVVLAEIGTTNNIIDKNKRTQIEKYTEDIIKKRIIELVMKVQKEYNSDIFGFGDLVKDKMPDLWRTIEDSWDYEFRKVGVEVFPEVMVKSSALISQPIQIDTY